MNRNFLLLTAMLALTGLVLAAPTWAGPGWRGMGPGRGIMAPGQFPGWGYGPFWRNANVAQALNLSDDQINKLEDLELARDRDLIDLEAAVKKAQLELNQVMKDRRPNQRKAERAAADLNEAQGRILQRQIAHQLAVNALLSDDQLRKLDDLKSTIRQERRENTDERQRRSEHQT
ncbi:MAG: hypothetical protein GX444_17880 [Myxococcales bacterium]|nr:hypothetical protein [Myxococcales bacterium]